MAKRGSPPPLVQEDEFIKVWNKYAGELDHVQRVAKELNMKYNSAWVRGARLLKKHGVKNPGINKKFELTFEKLESETKWAMKMISY